MEGAVPLRVETEMDVAMPSTVAISTVAEMPSHTGIALVTLAMTAAIFAALHWTTQSLALPAQTAATLMVSTAIAAASALKIAAGS